MILSAQRHAVDRVMCEAGFYAPRLAALAIIPGYSSKSNWGGCVRLNAL